MFYKNKKVLVTGGTGFVGRHLVEALLKQQAKVRVPVHERPSPFPEGLIETVRADLTNPEQCLEACRGVEIVFHAAGEVSAAAMTVSNPMAAITGNLVLTARMLEASWLVGVDRFLVFGSHTAYPAFDKPVQEEDLWSGPTHPVYFGYGWMRRYLERLSEFVASKSQMKIALVRPSAVYGCYDDFGEKTSHVIPALIRRAVNKENPYIVWGSGAEVRDFLHVADLARGCLLMIEKHACCDPVNIGYGQGVTIREVVTLILDACGHEQTQVIFDALKPSTIAFRAVDTSKAHRLLGFKPAIILEEGIRDTVEWYQRVCRAQESHS